MRIDFNASGLVKLTTRFSFLSANHSNSSAPPPAHRKEPSVLDNIFPMGGRVRDILDRGQEFGFFAKNIPVKSDDQFDCATIYIDGVTEAKNDDHPSLSLQVFKDNKSGSYFIGTMTDDIVASKSEALDDAGLYWKIFEWSKACATAYPSKRMTLIDTMSDRPTPSIRRAAQALIEKLGASLSRGFY